jgi:hypothetical protein
MIDEAQELCLQDYLLAMIAIGRTENLNYELACQRAELEEIPNQLLAKFRAFVACRSQKSRPHGFVR